MTALPIGTLGAPFANPMQFICSAIQAGSRLGYQESAELCAQYLAPILDAIKFNYLPFGNALLNTAITMPKLVSYSEERLHPPAGYKDTTVPGIFSRDPHCSRTATMNRAGSSPLVCRASRCNRSRRPCWRRSRWPSCWVVRTSCNRRRRPRLGWRPARTCPARRTRTTSATRCRHRGIRNRDRHPVRRRAEHPVIRAARPCCPDPRRCPVVRLPDRHQCPGHRRHPAATPRRPVDETHAGPNSVAPHGRHRFGARPVLILAISCPASPRSPQPSADARRPNCHPDIHQTHSGSHSVTAVRTD